MKKKKIVVLFPLLGLLLSGCTFQEGFASVKSWVGSHIYHPAKDFIDGLIGKKDNSSGGDGDVTPTPTPDPEPTPTPEPEPTPTPVNPEHKGTKEDPFTGKDACLVGATVAEDEYTEESYYVKGKVQEFNEQYDAQYGSYSFKIEDGFKAYRMKKGESFVKFNEGDIEIGDTVVMYGRIKNFKGTYEFDGTYNGGKAYVVSVEKPAPEGATLESIKIEGTAQSAYLVGDTYNHSGLTVKAHYDKGEDQDVTDAVEWVFSKEKAEAEDTEITITAKFNGKEASLKVAVTVQSAEKPAHAGTLEDPFTGLDAIIVAKTLQESSKDDRHPSEDSYYIKGVVQSFVETFDAQYGNFTFLIEGGFEGYRLLNGPDKAKFTSADQLAVGDTVTMYAQLLNFHGTYETEGGYIHSIEKPAPTEAELVSIKIEGSVKTDYIVGEKFGHAGLTVTATYSDEKTQDVTSAVDWSYSKDAAEKGQESVTITAKYKDETDSLVVQIKVSEPHAGTEDDPLTGADANAIASGLASETYSEQAYYVKGVVQSIDDTFNPQYGNYSFSIEDGFKGYRMKKENNTAFNEGDVAVGYTVLMYGKIKNYKGTYELDGTQAGGAYVVSVIEKVVPVEGVTLSQDKVEMEVGGHASLEAFVSPNDANPKVEWTVEQEGDIVSFDKDTGVITGLAVGSATITATSVENSEANASCAITVKEATKVFTGITIDSSKAKTEYAFGANYSAEGLVVTAHYSNAADEDVTEFVEWEIDPVSATAEGPASVSFTAKYNEASETAVVDVTVAAPEKGSLENPYSGAEAAEIAAGLPDKTPTADSYYIKGVITAFNETFNPTYGNYSFTIDGGFVGWRLSNGSSKAKFNEGDLDIGDLVIMYVAIQNYGGTPESSGGYVHSFEKGVVDSVVITGTPEQVEYGAGEAYNHKGLVATANLASGYSIDISTLADWDFSKDNAEVGDTEITVIATYKEVPSEQFAINVSVSSEPPVVKTYSKATSIAAGDSIAVVCEGANMYLTSISSTSTKYGQGSAVPESFTESSYELVVVAGSDEGTFAFKTSDNKYLCWTSGNSLNVSTDLNANSSWDVSIDANGNASIVNHADSTRQIWWNVSSPRFACYTGKSDGESYKITQIYKLA